jgi:hypothetical protein
MFYYLLIYVIMDFSFSSALSSFGRALETAEKLKIAPEDLAPIYNNMAHVYRRLGLGIIYRML